MILPSDSSDISKIVAQSFQIWKTMSKKVKVDEDFEDLTFSDDESHKEPQEQENLSSDPITPPQQSSFTPPPPPPQDERAHDYYSDEEDNRPPPRTFQEARDYYNRNN